MLHSDKSPIKSATEDWRTSIAAYILYQCNRASRFCLTSNKKRRLFFNKSPIAFKVLIYKNYFS